MLFPAGLTFFNSNITFYIQGEVLINREHEVFASFIKPQASAEGKYVARSAYVCSEHFIHSYHYVHVEKPAVIFLTYARHGDAASCAVISFPLLDGVDSVKEYERRILNEAEKYLEVSDAYCRPTVFS